ncbi:YkgJ family cysteine cluster protein [Mergibacter septicus]|uniref:YkgJ family cysteine cluster protein n=1 Tax=Mergibacter septicus TaxID=221402 RepID=UPI00223F5843|nr:YkgJ family cysteine cluster protein [Mergibacter septicus]
MAKLIFPCDQCGACCRHVDLSPETKELDRGDGICKYYNQQTKLCTIYANRPEICRVDKQYITHYKNQYSWQEFVVINLGICDILKKL